MTDLRSSDIDDDFLELKHYWILLWKQRWTLLLVTAIALLATTGYLAFRPVTYVSSARVLLTDPDTRFSIETEGPLASSQRVVELAAERSGLSARELQREVTATVLSGTQLLEITYQSRTPDEARRGAQAMAEAYLEFRRQIEAEARSKELHAQFDSLSGHIRGLYPRLKEATDARSLVIRARIVNLANELGHLQRQIAQVESRRETSVGELVEPAIPARRTGLGTKSVLAAAVLGGLVLGSLMAFLREGRGRRARRPREDQALSNTGSSTVAARPAPGKATSTRSAKAKTPRAKARTAPRKGTT